MKRLGESEKTRKREQDGKEGSTTWKRLDNYNDATGHFYSFVFRN